MGGPGRSKQMGDLNINEECMAEIEERIANLENHEAKSGRNRSINIGKEIEGKGTGNVTSAK